MSETCVKRSASGVTCGEPAVDRVDGQLMCALHAKEAAAKKGRKRGR